MFFASSFGLTPLDKPQKYILYFKSNIYEWLFCLKIVVHFVKERTQKLKSSQKGNTLNRIFYFVFSNESINFEITMIAMKLE
jgi:hypothetical protein